MTQMRSAVTTVERRWATMNVVRPWHSASSARLILPSVSTSSALVASSRMWIGASLRSARAMANPLPLASREHRPALAHDGLVALGLGGDEPVRLSELCCPNNLVVGRGRISDPDVVCNRAIEEARLLQHHGDVLPQGRKRHVCEVLPTDADCAAVRAPHLLQKGEERGLPGPRGARRWRAFSRA